MWRGEENERRQLGGLVESHRREEKKERKRKEKKRKKEKDRIKYKTCDFLIMHGKMG